MCGYLAVLREEAKYDEEAEKALYGYSAQLAADLNAKNKEDRGRSVEPDASLLNIALPGYDDWAQSTYAAGPQLTAHTDLVNGELPF